MSYIDQSTRPSPAGMAAVIGVHAAIGAILVAGLTVTGTIPAIITSTEATNIPIEPPPPKRTRACRAAERMSRVKEGEEERAEGF